MGKHPRANVRYVAKNELEKFDRTLEAIQEHYERHIQKERLAQQQRDAGAERER
jgi:hypothetical protein